MVRSPSPPSHRIRPLGYSPRMDWIRIQGIFGSTFIGSGIGSTTQFRIGISLGEGVLGVGILDPHSQWERIWNHFWNLLETGTTYHSLSCGVHQLGKMLVCHVVKILVSGYPGTSL